MNNLKISEGKKMFNYEYLKQEMKKSSIIRITNFITIFHLEAHSLHL